MENNNIILTSSGFNDANNFVSEESKALFCKISKGKKVMILSNAAPEGSGNFVARECVRKNFLDCGASQADIIDLSNKNISKILDYNIIYGLGGDPTYLIELTKIPKFKNTIIKFLGKGVYIGESAGSMILCDDLEWVYIVKRGTKPKYDIKLDTYKGLGLTDYNIFPHWNKVSDSVKARAKKYEEENEIHLTKLNNGEFILTNYTDRNPDCS